MEIATYVDAETVAQRAAEFIVRCARKSILERGQFALAVSGGSTPWQALACWVLADIPWEQVHVFQVDERVAPGGDERRNWTHLQRALLPRWQQLRGHVHAMPVDEGALDSAAARYATTISGVVGEPAIFDLVQLGLGSDGHTASLVPGDPVLDLTDREVAVTSRYAGEVRMTLTYPAIDRARHILWVVVGEQKRLAVNKLVSGDRSIPAGRVRRELATLITDIAAVGTAHEQSDPSQHTADQE